MAVGQGGFSGIPRSLLSYTQRRQSISAPPPLFGGVFIFGELREFEVNAAGSRGALIGV